MNEGRTPRRARSAKPAKTKTWFRSRLFKVTLAVFLFGFIAASGTGLYFYVKYSKVIDQRLSGEVFKNTARIYAAPYRIHAGQKLAPENVVERLQRAGFEAAGKTTPSSDGSYDVSGSRITIKPVVGDALRLDFQKGTLQHIAKAGSPDELSEAWLPAELVTNLFDQSREKRRLVEFKEIPKVLINALLASEDQRFYSHYGVDPIRTVGALWADFRNGNKGQGGSTITQQLARNFFLTSDVEASTGTFRRTWSRKINEACIAIILDQRLSKEQLLTMYSNEVYLGDRGSFSIHGFGEGTAEYFGKDIADLTPAEAATLVGLIPSPNRYNPGRHPDQSKKRRDIVLGEMHSLGEISDADFEKAKASDLKVIPLRSDATDAPYLVDFIREELLKDYSQQALVDGNLKVYTTLDPELQKAAVEAVDKGLKSVLDLIAARNKAHHRVDNLPGPQAAMIALDPHTGEIKAMVGGSNYQASQYNRIVEAFRQPGSIFKPLVYAAAFEQALAGMPVDASAVDKDDKDKADKKDDGTTPVADAAPNPDQQPPVPDKSDVITPITSFDDEPTTFTYEGGRTYDPKDFEDKYYGPVTARFALQHSLNVVAVRVAEKIGYQKVADFAARVGLNGQIKPYPSIALGAFEVMPIEMARAYTMFANEGKEMEPHALIRVVSPDAHLSKSYTFEPKPTIRPELAYLMTHLMEEVIAEGTAVGVRARGFTLPAAGKTGTSRDGWFAGYTKDLLAIAWVGYDDNRDLDMEGAHSALPIWTDFMIKAAQLYPPADPDNMNFEAPAGIRFAKIDADSLLLATPSCPNTFEEAFIEGTEPTAYCPLHGVHPLTSIEEGFGAVGNGVGTGAKDTGSAVSKAVQGLGHLFGNLFGGSADKPKEPPTGKPAPRH